MGVLDDAIREHIELQRLHGASEEELDRKEREALGPARREAPARADEPAAEAQEDFDLQRTEVLPQPDPEDFHEAAAPGEAEFASAQGDPLDDGFAPADGGLAAPDFAAADDEPLVNDRPLAHDEPFAGEAPFAQDEASVGDERFAGAEPFADDEPFAHPVEAEEDEDVLEETPEFLQETPEHDRLWFEQKPPRDFDFDDDEK